nr:hypothetical protein [Tanacetum cinerariifolium]
CPKKVKKKLTKKFEKEVSDEESLLKKGNKKLTKKVKKEESDEDSIPKKGDKIEKWDGQFYPLELKKVYVNDIARKLIAAQEIDFLFKDNFLTLFTNTMGKNDGLKGQICLDVVRRLREDSVISDTDWCGYIYDCLRDNYTKFDKFLVVRTRPAIRNWSSYLMKQRHELELKDHVVGLLDLHGEWNEAEMQESEDYMRKASLKCPGNGKFVALHEKYVNLFKDSISFEDDGNGDNVGDDDENGDDGGNVDNDANDCDGNGDEEDVNKGDKDPNGGNLSFGFSKTSLEDFGNDSGPAEKYKVVEGNPTEQGTVVEGNVAEEGEIMSTPENFTQWLEKNVDLVGEGDLFGDNSATLKAMNQDITPEKLPTQKGSPSPKKELVIQNKSHEIYSESHVIHSESHVIHSKSHVIHFESYSKSMFDGTLASFDAKWESFSNQVNAQFKGNKGGLALGGIDLLQRDMPRQLRFKFAMKILLHEITVHAGKMLELAKEFDKTDPVEKIAIIVDAFKKREEPSYDIMKLTSVALGHVKLLKNEFSLSDLKVVLINPYNGESIK